ncbi:hypothetical protein JFT44_14755 [Pseudomonas sp. MF5691]|uniref:hypothetical protein n=1 Tax=Pseudomonas TaxID=286 RepID=UPI0018E80938|nr:MULTISPECIES: hypothetical protein [Pseudomonas]MBJ2291201.1 hypothetical protein [Pseudomonas sp. MF5691]MBM6446145.1 hypothetical protein [Pseudomonas sp. MIL9]MCT8950040.1 hypothetical protein [Pseudomonas iridis]
MTDIENEIAKPKPDDVKKRKQSKPKTAAESKSVEQILSEVFAITTDKDQNIKPASISKADLKSLLSYQQNMSMSNGFIEQIVTVARKTDPELKCLSLITLAAVKCQHDAQRHELLTFCVRLASSLWIQRHRGSFDLYRDILDADKGLDTAPLTFLRNSVTELYRKRIEFVGSQARDATSNSDKAEVTVPTALDTLSKAELVTQRNNILLIGALWLMAQSKADPNAAIELFSSLLKEQTSRIQSNRAIALFLAEQYANQESLLADTIDYFKKQFTELADQREFLQSKHHAQEIKLNKLQAMVMDQHSTIADKDKLIAQLLAETEQLKHTLQEQQLDERATRTHLRDNAGQAKAKAFNLLSEAVLEPLKLSLAALQREKPKIEVAAHHIELAVESIEREIKWFSE